MVSTRLGRTPDGRRIEVVDEIDAPAERLWELLIDTRRWPEWGPWVEDVTADHRRVRTGTTGAIETPIGVRIPFEITGCVTFRWTWEIADVPATGHRVEPLNAHSRVVFEVPLLGAGSAPLCARALRNLAECAEQEA
ncbi:polyketide cyclase [Halobacteriales archaeon QS_1_67_19]|nr:MAG: polyketide cyclase [Halobacteriales archaeon QS_1_67_19]